MTICMWLSIDVGDMISLISFGCLCPTQKIVDVDDVNDEIRHQNLKIVTNKFRRQYPSPTSMSSAITRNRSFLATKMLVTTRCWWQLDVDDKWMLVSTWCWWQLLDVHDRISISVSSFGYWCPTLTLKVFL